MSRDNAIDFRVIAPDVARTLWGKEDLRLSNQNELRFGTNGSVAVPLSGPKRGSFYDFEAGIGGGVLDMIRHRTGCANRAAVDWLKSHGFVAANNETQKHSGHREARRVAAVYIYSDANGRPLYRKLRYHPKTFSFERADGRGGWVSGRGALDGVQRTLYRLADLKRAPASTTIFVTEGEKAADSLADRLLVATAAGGATTWPSPNCAPSSPRISFSRAQTAGSVRRSRSWSGSFCRPATTSSPWPLNWKSK
jgi:hypothetical protein